MARAKYLLLLICFVGVAVESKYVTDEEFQQLLERVKTLEDGCRYHDIPRPDEISMQNATIEERVSLLEIQVVEIEEDTTLLFEDVDFLFDEQVIQDERLFALEQDMDETEDDIENLEDTTVQLDSRVAELEENGGGSGGNSSVTELEERVEILEGIVANQSLSIGDLEIITSDHEARLTAAEENVEGLLTTDILLEERITALEEGGSGNSQNGTIAFHAALTSYSSIQQDTPVIFNAVFLNEGEGYDSATGTFTVPPGGDGFYYFSTELLVRFDKYGDFYISVNGVNTCHTRGENDDALDDAQHASCSAVASLSEGDEVEVIYDDGTDTVPLYESVTYMWNVFNGFRI